MLNYLIYQRRHNIAKDCMSSHRVPISSSKTTCRLLRKLVTFVSTVEINFLYYRDIHRTDIVRLRA